ncbi:MAG: hypothetical protein HKN34_00420 [Gammaproteobacteria bacterium]|nr:hypothetical protein [Gammaproteobacteria bacterium]
MRVFVLTTGRAASKTFAHACQYIDGMTSAHESNCGQVMSRLDYPDNHIEVDNRLVWFLGSIDQRYQDSDTFYVYLTRDIDKVVESYLSRWHLGISIVRAFYHGVLMNPKKPDIATAKESCRLFVQTVDENIHYFLRYRSNWSRVRVENLEQDFFQFIDKAGLSGDEQALRKAINDVHNLNNKKYFKKGWLRSLRNHFSSRRLSR